MSEKLGPVERSTLNIILMVVIGLIIVDIALRVSCCFLQGHRSLSSQVTLMGSGSTFIYPQLKHWISLFEEKNQNIVVNYNPTGSGAGQSQLIREKVVSFACSDPPLSHDTYKSVNGKILQMPVIVGAVVLVYKIPGYSGPLNLSANVIAEIYLGKIKYWDNPEIVKLNPKAKLPHIEIKAIHRSDASGTTQVFTFFLHKAAPSLWPENLVGKAINWPVDKTGRGLGAKGNQGVSEYFKTLKSAIAYVELGYALENKFSIAAIENQAGVFVKPNTTTMTAAVESALKSGLLPDSPSADWSNALQAIVYASGKNSYPIVSFSFMMVWNVYPKKKAEALKTFIEFINTIGQENVIEGYAPIPKELREINLKSVNIIRGT